MVVKSINPTPLNPLGNVLPMMVHVTAPATLPSGYTFEAAINDDESKIINVEVVRQQVRTLFLALLLVGSFACLIACVHWNLVSLTHHLSLLNCSQKEGWKRVRCS